MPSRGLARGLAVLLLVVVGIVSGLSGEDAGRAVGMAETPVAALPSAVGKTRAFEVGISTIDVSAMADRNDQDEKNLVLDLAEDAVVANPVTP